MHTTDRIFIAGRRGMVGSACWRALENAGYTNLVGPTSKELNLTRQEAVEAFMREHKPDYVILAAARVGGILANNTYPAEFIYINLAIQNNIIHSAWKNGVKKLVFLGSSCIYPKHCPQPMREEHLLTGPLEPTNEAYAIAKIAGVRMCQFYHQQYGANYWQLMPTNLYGDHDNFDLMKSHVLPAMIRKFHLAKLAKDGDLATIRADEAKYGPIPADIAGCMGLSGDRCSLDVSQAKVVLWGSGTPKREFLHVDDLAAAVLHVLNLDEKEPPRLLNVGCGEDQTIAELAALVQKVVGFDGDVVWDSDKPDGTPRKLQDVSRLKALGWAPTIGLEDGIRKAYEWYQVQL